MIEELIGFGIVAVLLALGFSVGRIRERSHLRSLEFREAGLTNILVTNLRVITRPEDVTGLWLVSGNAVISSDYFKTFVSGFRKLIGGRMRFYEKLAERARREAVVRMLKEAEQAGATEVWNVRVETFNVGGLTQNQRVMCEALAYGTAVKRGA